MSLNMVWVIIIIHELDHLVPSNSYCNVMKHKKRGHFLGCGCTFCYCDIKTAVIISPTAMSIPIPYFPVVHDVSGAGTTLLGVRVVISVDFDHF